MGKTIKNRNNQLNRLKKCIKSDYFINNLTRDNSFWPGYLYKKFNHI